MKNKMQKETKKQKYILFNGLRVETVYKDDPDYKLMRQSDTQESYSLEEVKKQFCKG
jgi:hypothetical protein